LRTAACIEAGFRCFTDMRTFREYVEAECLGRALHA